jgi:hypothetical protein
MTEHERILGIDPGTTGAIALFCRNEPNMITVEDIPTVNGEVDALGLLDAIHKLKPTLIAIERAGPMPKDGVRQAWRFSAAFTTARTIAMVTRIRTILVSPSVWKKELRLKGGKDNKEPSRARAIALFPNAHARFARKMDANRAEAALIAYYVGTVKTAQTDLEDFANKPKEAA